MPLLLVASLQMTKGRELEMKRKKETLDEVEVASSPRHKLASRQAAVAALAAVVKILTCFEREVRTWRKTMNKLKWSDIYIYI